MDQLGAHSRESALTERLAILETAAKYDRDISREQMSALWLRIQRIESFQSRHHSKATQSSGHTFQYTPVALKLIVAILLPALVLLVTGSPEKALTAARIVTP
jgi:hypothetical protein